MGEANMTSKNLVMPTRRIPFDDIDETVRARGLDQAVVFDHATWTAAVHVCRLRAQYIEDEFERLTAHREASLAGIVAGAIHSGAETQDEVEQYILDEWQNDWFASLFEDYAEHWCSEHMFDVCDCHPDADTQWQRLDTVSISMLVNRLLPMIREDWDEITQLAAEVAGGRTLPSVPCVHEPKPSIAIFDLLADWTRNGGSET